MNWKISIVALVIFGCRSDKASDTGAGEITEEEWWEVEEDSGTDTETDSDTQEQTDSDEKPDDEKPDDDKPDNTTPGLSWTGTVKLDTLEGVIEHTLTTDSGNSCSVSYAIINFEEALDCAACSHAYHMTLDAQTMVTDGGACDDMEDLGGDILRYGQGSSSFGTYEGIEYFDLMFSNDGVWETSAGYSGMAAGNTWLFGEK